MKQPLWSRRQIFKASLMSAGVLALPALGLNRSVAAAMYAAPLNTRPHTGPFPPQDPFMPGPLAWNVLAAPVKPVAGTDGQIHLIYEMQLTNASHFDLRIDSLELLDGLEKPITGVNQILSSDGVDVTGKIRPFAVPQQTQTAADYTNTLGPGQSGVVYGDVTYPTLRDAPKLLKHRITCAVMVSGQPVRTFTEIDAGTDVIPNPVPVISPPLKGANWVIANGSGRIISPHRYTVQPTNGTLRPPEHFAIDFMQLNAQGKAYVGDPKDVNNWPYYGADIVSILRGRVIEMRNDMANQIPLQGIPPTSGDDYAGNHVILDHGRGIYSLYAHMAPQSVIVKVGDMVRQGQTLGKLGNSGNTDGPHLHFHVMNTASALNTNGLPFMFDQMTYQGHLDGTLDAVGNTVGSGEGVMINTANAGRRVRQMPLTNDVVSFG